MNLVLSQKNTIGSKILAGRFDRRLLKRLSRRSRTPRLRRKRPQWGGILGIALLVLAGDIVLAVLAWIVVDFFLR